MHIVPKQATTLVVGADGLIGGALEAYLRYGDQSVIGTTRRTAGSTAGHVFLDMAAENVDLHIPQRIDAAVLCAAVTGHASCENDPLSQRVNVTNTVRLASRLLDQGVFVVFLSTNAVFSGTQPFPTENAPTQPATAYGRQKAEAEARLLSLAAGTSAAGRLAIVRLTKVVSARTSPLANWIDNLLAGKAIQPFSDLIFSPVSLVYVVKGLSRLLQAREAGIQHCSGSVDMAYAEFAAELAKHLRVDLSLVQPVTSAQAGVTLPFRPGYSALGVTADGAFGVPESIGSVLTQLPWPNQAIAPGNSYLVHLRHAK